MSDTTIAHDNPDKLQRGLLAAIEACWLFAIVAVPLLFVPDVMTHSFEVPKVTMFRSVAGIMAILCLALWAIGRHRLAARRPIPLPLLAALLAFVVANVAATTVSVSPQVSLWGYPQRMGGLYTTLSFVAFALMLAWLLRSRRQVDRLLWAMVLGGSLVSIYGIVEYLGVELFLARPYGTWRIGSTLGNPIFLGAYLVTIIPFTLSRLIATPKGPRQAYLKLALMLALGLQLAALVLSQARGPWLGLAVMASVFVALIAVKYRRRLLLAGFGAIIALALLIHVGLNVAGSPVYPLRELPVISRFAEMSDFSSGGGQGRLLVWRSLLDLLRRQPALSSPGQSQPYRLAVGYGPETVPYTSASGLPHLGWDRAHNLALEQAVTTGLLGLTAFLSFLAAIYFYLGRRLRHATSPGDQLLAIALLAGLSGHLAEQAFGIAQPADQMQLWTMAALAVALAARTGAPHAEAWGIPSTSAGHRMPPASAGGSPVSARGVVAAAGGMVLLVLIVYANVNLWRADMHLAGAVRLMERQDAPGAVHSLQAAASLAPYHGLFHMTLADTYRSLATQLENRAQKELLLAAAVESVTKAESLEPLNAVYLRARARIYDLWAQASDAEKTILADRAYGRAAQLRPQDADLWREWSQFRISLADYSGAIDILKKSLAWSPERSSTYRRIGDLYQTTGQHTEAAAAYRGAIELDAEDWEAYLGLAQSLGRQGAFEEALPGAETYVTHVPGDWQGHMVLASVYSGLGLKEMAVQEIATALALAPPASQDQLRAILEQMRQG